MKNNKPSAAFKVGAVSLAFMIIGYQAALFMHRAAVLSIESRRDRPDTVFVYVSADGVEDTVRHDSPHTASVAQVRGRTPVSTSTASGPDLFSFDPNTASIEDFRRLGFSEKQAVALDNYRAAGGHFSRPSDFAKSFVVSEETFRRLEPFIDIPKVDINKADSADFDALPGIGPYYAARMVAMRESLGGYSCTEQLMDIGNFGEDRYRELRDLVECSAPQEYPLWTADERTLSRHPFINSLTLARAIILYRQNNPPELLTIEGLRNSGVISAEQYERLSRCRIAPPVSPWNTSPTVR